MQRFCSLLSVGVVTLALGACAGGIGDTGPRATARLEPTKGSTASGEVTFVQSGSKVIVTADIRGLKPNAEHGFHVHERGDCSSGDGMSTGGHFNPLGHPHAGHGAMERHVGDMPNLKADASGRAVYRTELDVMKVAPGATSIVGKGLIVHRDPDDYRTQPTGNAGPRLACAVIQAA